MSKIASLAKSLFRYVKERVLPDLADEAVHSVSRGASEIAAALFTERGFVMYGPHRGPATEPMQQAHQPQAEQNREASQEMEHEL